MNAVFVRVKLLVRRVPRGIAYFAKAFFRSFRKKPSDDINTYEKRIFSQNGEDGIIAEIFARLAPTRRFFVEFGIQDGLQCNGAELAYHRGWSGLMIEGDPTLARRAARNYRRFPVRIERHFVDRDNIAAIFRDADVPTDLELLSIDIDGNDYWVWEALEGYRAALVVIEFNATFPPPSRWVMAYDPAHLWNGTTYHGASLSSLTALARRMGYELLGTDRSGVNAFYLRDDLVSKAGFRVKSPDEAFHFQKSFPKLPYGSGPFIEV